MKIFMRMLTELKQWKVVEIVFSSILVVLTALMSIITAVKLNIEAQYVIYTIFAVITFIFFAKGTFLGYLLSIGCLIWYSFIAFSQSFYGELIAGWIFLFPYLVGEIAVWFKPELADKKSIKKKWKLALEVVLVFLCIALLGYGSLNLLAILNCNRVVISSIGVCAACAVLYLSSFKTKIFEAIAFAGFAGCGIYLYVQSSIYVNFNYILVALSCALMVLANLVVAGKRIYSEIKNRKEKRERFKDDNSSAIEEKV